MTIHISMSEVDVELGDCIGRHRVALQAVSEVQQSCFQTHFQHLLALWSWANYLSFLSLDCFFICKMGIKYLFMSLMWQLTKTLSTKRVQYALAILFLVAKSHGEEGEDGGE